MSPFHAYVCIRKWGVCTVFVCVWCVCAYVYVCDLTVCLCVCVYVCLRSECCNMLFVIYMCPRPSPHAHIHVYELTRDKKGSEKVPIMSQRCLPAAKMSVLHLITFYCHQFRLIMNNSLLTSNSSRPPHASAALEAMLEPKEKRSVHTSTNKGRTTLRNQVKIHCPIAIYSQTCQWPVNDQKRKAMTSTYTKVLIPQVSAPWINWSHHL